MKNSCHRGLHLFQIELIFLIYFNIYFFKIRLFLIVEPLKISILIIVPRKSFCTYSMVLKLFLLNSFKNVYLDVINEDSINNVDVKTLKTVKIMVEKLDDQFMLNNLKSCNKLNDEETADDDKLILQNECISSNVEGDIKRKLDNVIDLDPNYLQKEPNKDCLSADVMLMKRPRSTSVSPDNSLKIKMKRSNSFSCILKCHSDNVKNNIKSNVVQKKKLTSTLSLSFLSLDATKQLSRSKTLGSKVFDELNNIIVTVEHGHSLSRNTYELRDRATSSKNISSSSETSDLKGLKGLKLNDVIPPLNFNSEKKLCKLRSRSNSSSYVSTRSTSPEYKNVEELKPRYITSDSSISKKKSLRSQPISYARSKRTRNTKN